MTGKFVMDRNPENIPMCGHGPENQIIGRYEPLPGKKGNFLRGEENE